MVFVKRCWSRGRALTALYILGVLSILLCMYNLKGVSFTWSGPTTANIKALVPNKEKGTQPLSLRFSTEKEARLPVVPRREAPVDMDAFYQCMAERLGVDLLTRTQRKLVNEDTIPLLLFPFMMEVADLRALMCSIQTPVRYFVFVHNGGIPEVSDFFDDLEAVFGWTGRLTVRRNYENNGFSACVNAGIAAALAHSIEEVPFMFVSNVDVRYTVGGVDVLSRRIRRFHQLLAKDGERITQLQEEVAAEPSMYTPGGKRSLRGMWSAESTLVTSALLPDRIRYAPRAQQERAFSDHYGWLGVQGAWHGCAFALSRLAMLTVGYWDENNYPAYSEDFDYYWRVKRLGFRIDLPSKGEPSALHYGNAIWKSVDAANGDALISPRAVQLLNEARAFRSDYKTYGQRYFLQKWGVLGPHAPPDMGNSTVLFRRSIEVSLPIDAWVRDTAYARRILERNRSLGQLARPEYNAAVIKAVKQEFQQLWWNTTENWEFIKNLTNISIQLQYYYGIDI